jgi:O-antigen ligase
MGWAAVATAVASLVMAARGQSIQPDGRLLAWLWPEPNSAAAIFSVVLIGFVYHHVLPVRDGAVRRPLILTLLNLLATAIMLVFLALTGSRIASVGAVFGLLLVAWKGTKSRRIRLALIVGLAAVCLAAVGAMWHRWERGIVTDESSLYINLWQHYFDLGLERPWLGHGIMASEQIVHGEQILTNSHNKLIDAFYYGGVVAVVLMLALIVVASRAAWLAWRREADPVPAALLVCCVTYTYGIPAVLALFWKIDWWWIHCWLPLGLIAGAELRNSGPARRMFEFPRASVLGPAALQSPSPVI